MRKKTQIKSGELHLMGEKKGNGMQKHGIYSDETPVRTRPVPGKN
jgi:hypothetical protein